MILIVDDQKDIGTALERLLRYSGHNAVAVTDPTAALSLARFCKPALIVLDVNMPEMDGLTVLRVIKEHAELRGVRVAMYSADPRDEIMLEAKRLGALDFIVKGSLGFDQLVSRISELAIESV